MEAGNPTLVTSVSNVKPPEQTTKVLSYVQYQEIWEHNAREYLSFLASCVDDFSYIFLFQTSYVIAICCC